MLKRGRPAGAARLFRVQGISSQMLLTGPGSQLSIRRCEALISPTTRTCLQCRDWVWKAINYGWETDDWVVSCLWNLRNCRIFLQLYILNHSLFVTTPFLQKEEQKSKTFIPQYASPDDKYSILFRTLNKQVPPHTNWIHMLLLQPRISLNMPDQQQEHVRYIHSVSDFLLQKCNFSW